jgi:hypothetical protein
VGLSKFIIFMGKKIARLPRKFSTEAWRKIELFNIFPQVGKNMREGERL